MLVDTLRILTAIGSVLAGLGLCVGAIPLLVSMRRTARDTHKIVNSQREAMLAYQRDLTGALTDPAGAAGERLIPPDKSLPG